MKLFAQVKNRNKKTVYIFIVFVLLLACPFCRFVLNRAELLLENYLNDSIDKVDCGFDALYVLGGSQESTLRHIVTAAKLYKDGKTKRILIYDSSVKCEYDPFLKRNLTKNEWLIKNLTSRGVPAEVIDTVTVTGGFFGTFSEAESLRRYVEKKKLSSLILVSSKEHTRRVAICFKHFMGSAGVKVLVVGSNDPFSFKEKLLELLKIFVYKTALL